MSLLVYTAHAGGCHRADSAAFDSLTELKLWIEKATGLSQPFQIIMSARGTAIKLQSLINEKEIYVFDRRLLESGVLPRSEPIPPPVEIPNAPSDLQNERDLGSWKALFERRVAWADTIVSRGTTITSNIHQIEASLGIMKKSVLVAFANLNQHYGTLRQSAEELRGWADGTLKDQKDTVSTWERSYRQLSQLPLHERLGALAKSGSYGPAKTLQDLFKPYELQKAANDSEKQAKAFIAKVTEASDLMVRVGDGIENLGKEIEQARYKLSWDSLEDSQNSQITSSYGNESQSQGENEPELLLHDMNAVSKKIKSDYDRLMNPMPGVPITLPQVSKWAHNATKELLPALAELLRDLSKHHRQAIDQKNRFSAITAKYLQAIATFQGQAQPTKGEVDKIYADLTLDSEGYQQLHTVSRLPLLYGSLLIECVRRKEWQERLTADSRRMAEEFALLKEDEEKKRKKFQRTTGELLPFKLSTDSTLSVVDLSMRTGDDKPWPNISRQDVEAYIQRLRTIDGMDSTIKELTAQFADLDKPAKRRSKTTRGFKMGSVHEANMAASSFFPNDDMARLLREEKARSLEKARNYEIRIKKLEELAYRNISRGATGTPGPGPAGPYPLSIPGTPLSQQQFNMQRPQSPSVLGYPDSPSRPASVNSRRFSFIDPNANEKEKQLTARIAALETELAQEQDKTARLERDAAAHTETEKGLQVRISEVESTKRDLVANLEALQAEFLNERKSLNSTIDELKQKLYEVEEELYRVDELRAQEESKILSLEERLTYNTTDFEQKVKSQEEQITHLNSLLKEKEQLAEQQRDGLESWKAQVGRKDKEIDSLSDALEQKKDEVNSVNARLAKMEKELLSHAGDQAPVFNKAKEIHKLLSDETPPSDYTELIESLYKLTVKINRVKEELSENARKAEKARDEKEAELSSTRARFNSRTQRAKEITNKLYSYNTRCIQLLEQLGFSVVRRENSIQIVRLSRSNTSDSNALLRSTLDASRAGDTNTPTPSAAIIGDINLLYWMDAEDSETESDQFQKYLSNITAFDMDTFAETIAKRLKDAEHMARKYQRDARSYREKYHKSQAESSEKIAYKSFKEGDLALFLPTRNQASRPWAAFNVGAPHYFLREQDSHKLRTRDWLLARITKVEEKVVDLSRPTTAATVSSSPSSSRASSVNENPFELSDGLRWYFLDAVEEKPGAPATPGLGSSTVASAKVDAKACSSVRPSPSTTSLRKPSTATSAARKTLTDLRETESRRRSGSSASTRPTSMVLTQEDAVAVRSAATAAGGNAFAVGTPSSGNSMMVGMSPPVCRDGGVLLGAGAAEKTEKTEKKTGPLEKFVGFMKGEINHHD